MRTGGLYRRKRHHRFRSILIKDHGLGDAYPTPAPERVLQARRVRERPKVPKRKRTKEQERLRKRRQRARLIAKGFTTLYRPVHNPAAQAHACRLYHPALCNCRPCRLGRRLGI